MSEPKIRRLRLEIRAIQDHVNYELSVLDRKRRELEEAVS